MKNQILYYFFLTTWLSSITGANGQDKHSNPKLITQKRSVAPFSRLRVGSAMQVSIREGALDQLEFTCQDYVVPVIPTGMSCWERS